MKLSTVLRDRLARLQRESGVRFDEARKCLVDANDKRKRGLTHILSQLIPVAGDVRGGGEKRRSRARQGKNDPVIVPITQRFSGATMRRCGTCAAALAHARQYPGLGDRLVGESDDKAHGMLVDIQLTVYATRGGRNAMFAHCGIVDPCVGTLIEQLDAMGWSIVASQLPLYSSAMDVGTVADLACTDRATRTQLNQVEVKSSLSGDDVNYERIRGRNKGTALHGIPQSYVSRHMGQLLCTDHMVRQQFDFSFDRSCVMRVSPGLVRTYDLNAWYVDKLPKFIMAIGLKTGKQQRVRRKIVKLRVQKPPRRSRKKQKRKATAIKTLKN